MYISSQLKSALRKLRDWEKARIVTVYYSRQMYLCCTSLVLHIWRKKWTSLFAEFKCFD